MRLDAGADFHHQTLIEAETIKLVKTVQLKLFTRSCVQTACWRYVLFTSCQIESYSSVFKVLSPYL